MFSFPVRLLVKRFAASSHVCQHADYQKDFSFLLAFAVFVLQLFVSSFFRGSIKPADAGLFLLFCSF